MKRYKLKKNLPTFNVGEECFISNAGNLCLQSAPWVVLYSREVLKKFPNILTEWFEEIPDGPKTVDVLRHGDTYFTVTEVGAILEHIYIASPLDDSLRERGLIFLTKEDTRKYDEWRKAKVILERDTKGFKARRNNKLFYYVYYDIYDRTFGIGWWDTDCLGGELTTIINFASEEDAKASIKAHEKEWKIYLGVEND